MKRSSCACRLQVSFLLALILLRILSHHTLNTLQRSFRRGEGESPSLDENTSSLLNTSHPNPWNFQIYSPLAPACTPLHVDDDVDFTLVTQTSQDRLHLMKEHCQRWPHSISLAICSNTTVDEKELRRDLSDMGCVQRHIRLSFLQIVGNGEEYPVNALRNLALAQVATSHVLYVDIDFLVSHGAYEELWQHRQTLRQAPKKAVVLPAFEISGCRFFPWCLESHPERLIPNTKEEARRQYNHEGRGKVALVESNETCLTSFDGPRNRDGHNSTDYLAWFRQDPDALQVLPCLSSDRYEPYIAFRYCRDTPPFPEAFAGYGRNKMVWFQLMHRMGWEFWRASQSFVTHVPHHGSPAKDFWKLSKNKAGKPKSAVLSDAFAEWLPGALKDQRRHPYCPESNGKKNIWYPLPNTTIVS